MKTQVKHNDELWDYFVTDTGIITNNKGHELHQRQNNSGYMVVDLYKNKKPHTITVHRIVAETFLDKTDDTVNHKDGDKTNNSVDNLEWVSYGSNNKHSYDTGLKESLKGEASPFAKHSESEVRKLCELLEVESSPKRVAEITGYDLNFIKSIKSGNAWTSVSKDYDLVKPRFSMPKSRKAELSEWSKYMTIDEILDKLGWPHESKYIKRIKRAIAK